MRKKQERMEEKRGSGNLSSFIHFIFKVVFIELFLKIDTLGKIGNDIIAKWKQKGGVS